MSKKWKVRLLFSLLFLTASAGCNPLTAMYFLLGGPKDKIPPEFPLITKDRKEPKVLVLSSCSVDLPVDFIGVDRMLASEFVKALNFGTQANKEKITLIPISKVEKYKSDNPSWRAMDPIDIGKHFEADHVIDLEILGMSLYESGSKQLLHGRAVVSVTAYDVNNPEQEPRKSEHNAEYPRGHVVDVLEKTPSKFRAEFVQRMAIDLSWKFTSHEFSESVGSGMNRTLD